MILLTALTALSLAGLAVAGALHVGARSPLELVLSAAVLAYGWLVAISLVLSQFDRFTGNAIALTTFVAAIVALVTAYRRGLLADTPWDRPTLDRIRATLRDGRIIVLLAVTAVGLVYSLALALFTPPAELDAIEYHLTRAAFWIQQHAIATVPGTFDPRVNGSPPGAEVVTATTILATGTTRFVGLVQWTAIFVLVLATFGVARRVGHAPRPAFFGALLVASLPLVALQAPTALNDVTAAALVCSATYFALGGTRRDALMTGVAVACMTVTKMTAFVAIVPLVVVAALALRGRARLETIAAAATGVALSSLWLFTRPATTNGETIGGVPTAYTPGHDLLAPFGRLSRYATELFELPGATGRDVLLYPLAGLLFVCIAAATRLRHRTVAIAAVLIVVTAALVPGAELAARVHRKAWYLIGKEDLAYADLTRPVTGASATSAYYGAIGLAIVVIGLYLALRPSMWSRNRVRTALGLAPIVWIAAYSVGLRYSPWEGRFFLPGIALGAAATAPFLYRPALAWWAVAVTGASLVLVWTHSAERPSGVRLLERASAHSVWTRDDAVALGQVRAVPEAIRSVERVVPADAQLAIWPSPFPDPSTPDPVALQPWPFFGSHLGRTLVFAASLDAAGATGASWALLPRYVTTGCRVGWRRETARSEAYQVFRRDPTIVCTSG